jgi:hypothetical protein
MADEEVERPFVRIKISGERFEGGRLPVDALGEIQRYQAVLLAAARREWLDDNPGEEIPEDFNDKLGLVIAAVEPGSAQILLERPEMATDFDVYFERGRDEFERELSSLLDPTESVNEAPLFELKEFQSFGISLLAGDAIQVTSYSDDAKPKASVSLTEVSRAENLIPRQTELKKELRKRRAASRHAEDRAIAGRLIELNPDKGSFTIRTLHFGELTGWYTDSDITQDLKLVLESSAKAPVVRVRGDLQFRNNQVTRLRNVSDVQLLEIDGQPWSRKLVELATLGPDWDGDAPGAEMISFAALDAARDLMLQFTERDVPRPSMSPTEDGGVMLEWSSPAVVATIEISPDAEFLLFLLPEGTNESTEEDTTDITRAAAFGFEVAH